MSHLLCLVVCSAPLFISSAAFAVEPPPGGGYPNNVTALGDGALSNSTPAADNTGLGFNALNAETNEGEENTAVGSEALASNISGPSNSAVGYYALGDNTTGGFSVAVGYHALIANTTGSYSVAIGEEALQAHTTGVDNVAVGPGAMALGTTGNYNTAIGSETMAFSGGTDNVAVGDGALNMAQGDENIGIGQGAASVVSGSNNIAIGESSGQKLTSGGSNILLGQNAGLTITTGSNNIEIASQGNKRDSGVIRIGDASTQKQTFIAGISGTTISGGAAVMVNSKGQLGVATSSARFKDDIKPMKDASDAILSLQPVTFRYKKEIDSSGIPQFGLVAEDVAKVDPDLVIRDDAGKPFTVRYEAVNAMLLNEFLKEHREVQTQREEIASLKTQFEKTVTELQAALKTQAAQIQKVSATVQAERSASRLVSTNP